MARQKAQACLSWILLTSMAANGPLMAYLICASKSLAFVISSFRSESSISYSQGKPLSGGFGLAVFFSGPPVTFDESASNIDKRCSSKGLKFHGFTGLIMSYL